MKKLTLSMGAIALSVLCISVWADEEPATPIPATKKTHASKTTYDKVSKNVIDAWRKMEYRWTSVKKAHATITAKVSQMGQAAATKGVYKLDGEKSELTYDAGQAAAVLNTQGWDRKMFDRFWKDMWDKDLEGGTFKAEKIETGTKISVTGKIEAPYRVMYFDANGVMTHADVELTNAGMTMKGKFTMTHKKLSTGKYVMSEFKIELDVPGGKWTEIMTLKYKDYNGVVALVKADATGDYGGMPQGMTKDIAVAWKFNDDVK